MNDMMLIMDKTDDTGFKNDMAGLPQDAPRARARILLVDDIAAIRKRLREILEPAGYEIVGEAEDGYEAVAMAGELVPDLILMDIVMKRMDGLEATTKISRSGVKSKIVMFTQEARPSSVIRCMRTGAVNFVIKPSNEKQLLRVVENALRQ